MTEVARDAKPIVDEVFSVGGSGRQPVESRPTPLIDRLLQGGGRPGHRTSDGIATIPESRRRIARVVTGGPSLERDRGVVFEGCHHAKCLLTAKRTRIDLMLMFELAPPARKPRSLT